MKFTVLGPVCAAGEGGAAARLSMPLQRQMLAVLILRGGMRCESAWLQDTVWGTGRNDLRHPDTALRTCVYRLRAALDQIEEGRIRTEPAGYQLEIRPGEDDVSVFRDRIKAGLAASDRLDWAAAERTLASALELWGDPPLPDLPDTLNARDLRQHLTDEYLGARDACYDVKLHLGRHERIIPELRAWTREHPYREHAWAQLLLALYRSGQRAAALTEASAVRALFIQELGADVGHELQRVTEQVTHDDPELMLAVTGRSGAWEPMCELPADDPDPDWIPDPLQVDAVVESLHRPGVPVVVITGNHSSDFVNHIAWRVSDLFPDGQLYARLTNPVRGTPRVPGDVLAGKLQSLGVPPMAIPRDDVDRAGRFRDLLKGRKVLVVADDARTAAQVTPLVPNSHGCAVLVAAAGPLTNLRASLTVDLRQTATRHDDRPLAGVMLSRT
jgi:DNA-binding SARP family transcriptional activator